MNQPVTKKDLWLALFSLDSYHRDYGIQVRTITRSETHLGNAEIITRPATNDWKAAGFYAQAYDITNVTGLSGSNTVIAYRGTDYDETGGYKSYRDMLNGWTVGAGYTGNDTESILGWTPGGQGALTIQFYEAVVQALDGNQDRTIFDLSGAKPITTGHSLGGGLAGLVALLSGSESVGFDHMPFGVAAFATLGYHVLDAVKAYNAAPANVADQIAEDATVTPELLAKLELHNPNFNIFKGISTAYEVNAGLRNGLYAAFIGVGLGAITAFLGGPLVGGVLGGLIANYGGDIAGGQITAERQVNQTVIDTYGWTSLDPVKRHSQALLTILTFDKLKAQSESFVNNWHTQRIANSGLWALYDEDLAKAAGANGSHIRGLAVENADPSKNSYSTVLLNAIAYSVIDEGEDSARPFGDTGVHALIDDWAELGWVINFADHNKFFDQNIEFDISNLLAGDITKDVTTLISRITTQYAGALAIYDVEQSEASGVAGGVNAKAGVLGKSDAVLALDLSSILWGDVIKAGGVEGAPAKITPVDEELFKSAYFEQAEETSDGNWFGFLSRVFGFSGRTYQPDELTELVKLGWGEVWGAGIGADNVDRFHMAAREGLANVTLDERSYSVPTAPGGDAKLHIDVYIGQAGNETITGTQGNDLIIGGGLVIHLRNEQAANDNGTGERAAG